MDRQRKRFHKKIRLDPSAYVANGNVCLVTICTEDGKPVFQDPPFTQECIALLSRLGKENSMAVYAYCFMPDHLHLLLSTQGKTGIILFIRKLKSLTGRLFTARKLGNKLWQTSFYDHFLRKEENLETAIEYILNNPVRRGFVRDWKQYPFSGSLVFALRGDEQGNL